MRDADDLAALIKERQLGPVHIVAHSYGGYAALFLAVRHPELVRSLVLAEPAALRWAKDNPEARSLFADQIKRMCTPAGEAFSRGDDDGALRVALEYFEGKDAYDQLPDAARQQLHQKLPEWRALALLRDTFPPLPLGEMAKIDKAVLLMTGDSTQEILPLRRCELQRQLPKAQHVVIPHARHEMWADNGDACRQAALKFLAQQH